MGRRLRSALVAVGGLGLAGTANRALKERAGDLPSPLPGDDVPYRWRGIEVEYTEAGDPDDPDLLLLHGIHAAGTRREFRPLVEELTDDYHVIAPDLPGFGRSERPPLVYSASLYESFLREFAGELTPGATCVASSLSGAYAAQVADEGTFDRLVLACPTAETGPRRLWLRTLLRAPVVGTGLYHAAVSKPSLRYFGGKEAYADPGKVADELDYWWTTGHQPGARYAPASFVSGYLAPDVDLGATLADLDVPVTLAWGRDAPGPSLSTGRDLAERADATLAVFDDARLLPHAEHPGEFRELLAAELPRANDE